MDAAVVLDAKVLLEVRHLEKQWCRALSRWEMLADRANTKGVIVHYDTRSTLTHHNTQSNVSLFFMLKQLHFGFVFLLLQKGSLF